MTIPQLTYIIISIIAGYNMALNSIHQEWDECNHAKKSEAHIIVIFISKFLADFIIWPIFISRLIWNKLTK